MRTRKDYEYKISSTLYVAELYLRKEEKSSSEIFPKVYKLQYSHYFIHLKPDDLSLNK